MTIGVDNLAELGPSATPSAEDMRLWDALPRDEQLRRLRTALADPDCSAVVPESMAEIAAAARSRTEK